MTIVTRPPRGVVPLRQSPLVLAGATIALGVAAHVLGGGGSAVECLPLLVASSLGVIATLTAQRVAGHTCRGAAAAATLLGIGQFAMHLALSVSLGNHFDLITAQLRPQAALIVGLSCGLVVAHTAATALLVILLLGAHQSADLAIDLLTHARRQCRILVLLTIPRSISPLVPTVPTLEWATAPLMARQLRYGLVRPRRGPPEAFAG